jgi:two-component system CheB/CheR fusion protein
VETPSARRRILVVDDNVDAADTTAYLLRFSGFEARAVYNGLQAVETSRSFRPALVILDINMPVMDGYRAAAALRAEQPAGDPLFLVALTAYSQPADIERSTRAGFDRHVAKPADPRALTDLVGSLLDSAARR